MTGAKIYEKVAKLGSLYCVLVSCTGLKSRPRPGPQIWFEAQARPGPAAFVKTRKLNYEARARPGPQQVCPGPARPAKQFNMWGPGPAQARGPRAGLLARSHRHTKQQFYYFVHILMRLLSCYVRNHMHFQCLCEVYIMDIVHLWTSGYIYGYCQHCNLNFLYWAIFFSLNQFLISNYLWITFSLEGSIIITYFKK